MVPQESLLVILVGLIDLIPMPPEATHRKRGHPKTYPDRLFMKALVVMIVQQVHTPSGLLAILAQPTAEMQRLRQELSLPNGRFACRRTWERRLASIPGMLPAQIACLGCFLLALLGVWAKNACAAAIDSTVLSARGGVWHKKDREKGEVPHTSIDTDTHWTKSGWHGWVYGWKLHLVVTAACNVWLPLVAEVTPANVADNEQAPSLIELLPPGLHFLLGDQHYHDEALLQQCHRRDCILVTSFTGKTTPIHITMMVCRCVKSCTKSDRLPLKTSTNTLRLFSMFTVPCQQKAYWQPSVLCSVPFLFINWQSFTLSCKTWTYALVSKLSSRLPKIYVQASVNLQKSLLPLTN